MIGVIDTAIAIEEGLGVHRENGIGPERPDLPHQVLAEDEIVDERTVGLVEEGDPRVPDNPCCGFLLGLAPRRQLERIGAPVVGAGVAAGAAHEVPLRALVDPACGRRGRAEVRVVGVGDDHHEPLRSPAVRRS